MLPKKRPSQAIASMVGNDIEASNASWTFEGDVAKNFSDHVRRSVPLYDMGHQLVVDMSDFFLPSPSRCYELGCSSGELTQKLLTHHEHRSDIEWTAIDTSASMLEVAQQHCTEKANRVTWKQEDICLFDFESADMIIAYYTIQFVSPRRRQQLIDKIYQSLNWGGAFVLFEKVRGPDARFQDMYTHLYTEFKLQNGFKPEEIVHKSRSLKGILEPFSSQANLDMLKRAGFQDVSTVMKYLCFEGFLAIK